MTAESRYAQEYAKNVTAIERLAQAINNHPANAQPTVDGTDLTKEDFVRQLIASNEADLAVLEQEQSILGYMAKLVSLDALALSETVGGGDAETAADESPTPTLTQAVDLFVTR